MSNQKQNPTNVSEFKYEINPETDTITIMKFVGSSTDVVIPDQIEGRSIRTIFIEAFAESKIQSVFIPEGVIELNRSSFYKCAELTDVHLPESLEAVGSRSFAWCRNLQRINLLHQIQEIHEGAFEGCQQMAIMELPKSLNLLDESAFRECHAIVEITIPDGVQEIMVEAFRDCKNLRKVTIPVSTKLIEFGAFEGCSELAEIDIANPAIDIEPGVFEGTRILTAPDQCPRVRQENGWTIICDTIAIDYHGQDRNILIPEGVTSLSGFNGDKNLIVESVELPATLLMISGGTFSHCKTLQKLTLPHNLKGIGDFAFDECTNLHTIVMNDAQIEAFKLDFSDTPWFEDRFGKLTSK